MTVATDMYDDPSSELDEVEVYRSRRLGKSGWRWRYVAAGNHARLANGGESYAELSDLLDSMQRVVGLTRPAEPFDSVFALWGRADGSTIIVTVLR